MEQLDVPVVGQTIVTEGEGSPTMLSLLGSVVLHTWSTAVKNCADCEISSTEQELSLRPKNTDFMYQVFLLVVIWGPVNLYTLLYAVSFAC